MTRVLPFILAAIFIAAAVHLVSVLGLPMLATNDIYGRVANYAPVNEMTPLPQEQIGQMRLPFFDAAFETAACRYDLRTGVLRLRAPASDTLLMVTLVSRGGAVYFTVGDRAAIRNAVEVLVGTDQQITAIENADQEDEAVGELRVRAPSEDGVALVRVLAPTASMHPAAAAAVAQASCQIETLN